MHHRTSDPKVLLNQQLARANNPSEVFSLLESPICGREHHIMGLRMLSRTLKFDPSFKEQLNDARYESLIGKIKGNFVDLNTQDVSDYCFWVRVIKTLEIHEDHLGTEEELYRRIAELLDKFTSRQLINIFFDMSLAGKKLESLEHKLNWCLNNLDIKLEFSEIRQVWIGAAKSDTKYSEALLVSCIRRVNEYKDLEIDTRNVIGLLKIMADMESPMKLNAMVQLIHRLLAILNSRMQSFSESDIIRCLMIYTHFPTLPQDLLLNLYRKIDRNLQFSPSSLSKRFLIDILEYFKKSVIIRDLNFPLDLKDLTVSVLTDKLRLIKLSSVEASKLSFSLKCLYRSPPQPITDFVIKVLTNT